MGHWKVTGNYKVKDKKNPTQRIPTFIICKRKLQVDPRPGLAQRKLQILYSAKLPETTAQTVFGPDFQFPVTYRS